MNPFSQKIPTRTPQTEAQYVKTYLWLMNRFKKSSGKEDLNPDEVVAHLIALRPELAMKTYTSYKAAVLFYLNEHAPSHATAIEVLAATNSIGLAKRSARTSGRKKKQVPDDLLKEIREKIRDRSKLGYKYAEDLGNYIEATLLTGLRPNEWAASYLGIHEKSGRPVLHVQNSKNTNGRANGPSRELFIDALSADELLHLKKTIEFFGKADSVDSAQLALKHEIETTRMIALAKSKKWRASITLTSFRHQFIADAKITFSAPELISATVGHVSTKTAFEHYGARRHGRTRIKVFPTPETVEAVQKQRLEIYADFIAQRGQEITPTPPRA